MSVSEHSVETSAVITGVHAVAVNVADQDRALAFYSRILGCELRFDSDLGGGFRWIEVAPPGAHTAIALVAAAEESPVRVDTGIRLTTPDAEALHAAMVAAGVDVDEVLHWAGIPPMFSFRDVDANTLYIMETESEAEA